MPNQACRDALYSTLMVNDTRPQHLGLALSRCVPTYKSNASGSRGADYEEERQRLYTQFATISSRGSVYQPAITRWKRALKTIETVWQFSGVLASPLAMGLGLDVPMEVGMRLHHTYGTPLIPGSALKGITRQGARVWKQRANLSKEDFEAVMAVVFGDTQKSGACIFHDAWWEQGVNGCMVTRDTITVHHPLYYQGGEATTEWPSDFDDPTPISFLVVPAGTRFQFALDIPTGWEELVLDLVQWSLSEFGVGGKRNAGYGRFSASEWNRAPRPRFMEFSEWWYEPLAIGARIYAEGQEAEAIVLTPDQLQHLTVAWSESQRQDLGFVSGRQKIEENGKVEVIRLSWQEG